MAKTWDGTSAKVPEAKKAGCCGPITDRISLIRQVSQGLHDGHAGIAALYDSIAEDMEDKKEKKQFSDLAARHRKMGVDSLTVLVPDSYEEES